LRVNDLGAVDRGERQHPRQAGGEDEANEHGGCEARARGNILD
jgi:hypothetical protein